MLEDHPLTIRLIRTAKYWFPGLVKAVKQAQLQIAQKKGIRHRFTHIYHSNLWGNPESRSGEGSSLLQTAVIRSVIPCWLSDLKVKSLLDIPCGDYRWMKEMTLPLDQYVGADIVSEIIALNVSQYGGPGKMFIVRDLTKDRLPRTDCILCRDCLDHLSIRHIFKALKNIQLSGSTYLITTVYTDRTTNEDIQTGDWRPTNLMVPPFNFPPPLKLLNEQCTEEGGIWADKCLGLWRIADLPPIRR